MESSEGWGRPRELRVISLWLETNREENKSETAAVSGPGAVMAVTESVTVTWGMRGIVMSALIFYEPSGWSLSLAAGMPPSLL